MREDLYRELAKALSRPAITGTCLTHPGAMRVIGAKWTHERGRTLRLEQREVSFTGERRLDGVGHGMDPC
jgi:hypothetical protein